MENKLKDKIMRKYDALFVKLTVKSKNTIIEDLEIFRDWLLEVLENEEYER